MKDVDLGEPTSFLDHFNFGCTQRECQISRDIVDNFEACSNQVFLPEQWENYQKQKPRGNLMPKRYLHGPMTCMEGHAKKCGGRYCELSIQRRNKCTKSRRHALMTINLWRRNWISWRIVHSLLTNVLKWLFWLALVDLIFYGVWTNLLVRLQNGQRHVANGWRVWPLTFITQVNTGNMVMWETQHSNAE